MTLPMFGDDVMQEFAAFSADNMTHTATVQTAVKTTVNGRTVTNYPPRATTPARMSSLGPADRERLMAGAVASAVFVALYFPIGFDIRHSDRVVVVGTTQTLDDEAPVAWARTFNVIAIDPAGVAVEVHRRVVAQEVT